MDNNRLTQEVNRFDPTQNIDTAWMPPSSWYTDESFLALEQRAIFARTWQLVARVEQLLEPGSHVATCFGGDPWVVVRGDDGELRAFHNVCRHKGMVVANGCGTSADLVCGYHGWVYGLDGQLKSAPRVAGIKNFDRKVMSLPALRVEEWGPWVFVNADANAQPLAASVGHLTGLLDESGWRSLHYVKSQSWTIECNWKVYIDNYLDGGYHIPHMHPSLDAQLEMDSYQTKLFDSYSLQTSGAAGPSAGTVNAEQRIGSGAIYAWLYPNLMLNRYGPCLDSNYVVPKGPDRCEVHYDFFFADTDGEANQKFIAESIEQSAVTQREDIDISEGVQRGLKSSSYDRGRYAPRVEVGEFHFHQLLHRDYTKAIEAGL